MVSEELGIDDWLIKVVQALHGGLVCKVKVIVEFSVQVVHQGLVHHTAGHNSNLRLVAHGNFYMLFLL